MFVLGLLFNGQRISISTPQCESDVISDYHHLGIGYAFPHYNITALRGCQKRRRFSLADRFPPIKLSAMR